ncbi:hypothetical protein RHMOL_Rhmol04G0285200 [Rhododendron molle]|uniref:Uncharacterized protein n=1 Tax=Rhododendron molle TaxID=49168 RepID=A0ACC0P708_RHOML|nr:hypothetical protein RHMOL_Rhmol04G0285200 [Rhododendron molle]
MKKLPEKLNGYNAYEKIRLCMRKAVYDSLTVKQFEDAWDVFIKKYELQSNTWLQGFYLERKRWVSAYLKDMFWAGMSSTQRSESMNVYFNGYIHKKMTLKQFMDQYENALANKVESENELDAKSLHTYIPLLTEDELEKQFQSAYTNSKFQEFQKQFSGNLIVCVRRQKNVVLYSNMRYKSGLHLKKKNKRGNKCHLLSSYSHSTYHLKRGYKAEHRH